MTGPDEQVTGVELRRAMRRVPAAVTVVTVGGREPRGITIGSFTSLSLDPPLIVFNVQRNARMHALLARETRFAVHVLRESQASLSDRFADPDRFGPAQFEDLAHGLDDGGLPILGGTLAVFVCRRMAMHEAGDHSLFVGRVDAVTHDESGDPVLYFDRGYRAVGAPVPLTKPDLSSSADPG